jgi:16S rRNA processing protein RimM
VRLVVARVGRAHGIRGEVTVDVRTDVPEQRFVPGARLHATSSDHANRADHATGVDHEERTPPKALTLTVTAVRDHNGTLLLRFAEVTDRTAAEALRGAVLEADVPDVVDEEDAWYDHQLIGLRVLDAAGGALGQVVAVEHAPAQDLLVVRRPDGEQRLVPLVTALVPTVDVSAGIVVVDAPRGLLDDLAEDP